MSKNATIAFVPVLHAGYLNFFKKNRGDIFLLGGELIKELPYLGRELRALLPGETKKALEVLLPEYAVFVLDTPESLKILDNYEEIIAASEDITRVIVGKYLTHKKVLYNNVFLRWDNIQSLNKNTVIPDRKISREDFDKEIMERAYEDAGKSSDWWRQVGAVAVKDGNILFTSHNKHLPSEHSPYIDGDPRNNFDAGDPTSKEISSAMHAEKGLITKAARDGVSLRGVSVYVTTFPCPVCAMALAETEIGKLYYTEGYSILNAEKVFRSRNIEIILVER